MDQWEGQHWNRLPGNLYSEPQKIQLSMVSSVPVRINLTQKIPPIEPPADTKYVKHLKFKSEILSRWWGHDMYLGAVVVLPEGFDEHPNQMVNIYQDTNAFYPNSAWKREPVRPWQRGVDDQVMMSQKDASHLEEVLGTRGRSGDQMDIFFSVYGPVGADGYPKLLYDKWTGVIDTSVAEYWREHYDLRHILERDWKRLGPKLVGKLHLYVGEMDTYYLEEAALLLQKFLDGTTDPYYAGSFDLGARAPHCYSGKPEFPGQGAEQRVFPQMLERILKTAPPGADLTSWRY